MNIRLKASRKWVYASMLTPTRQLYAFKASHQIRAMFIRIFFMSILMVYATQKIRDLQNLGCNISNLPQRIWALRHWVKKYNSLEKRVKIQDTVESDLAAMRAASIRFHKFNTRLLLHSLKHIQLQPKVHLNHIRSHV